jgi:ATP-independent RNA helicase DbpA
MRRLRSFVLDEADRMLDMGFQVDMEKIFATLPKSRQTVFFSATFPPSIAAMSRSLQVDPLTVSTSLPGERTLAADVKQAVCEVPPGCKLQAVETLLATAGVDSAIVFCNHKATVADLAKALRDAGHSADALHGDLMQDDRDRVLAKLRNQSIRVLVATDVAARGIDIVALDLVVNFDLPPKPDTYVHRIGRTGRAGKSGLAISLVYPKERSRVGAIEALNGRALERRPLQLKGEQRPPAKPLAAMQTLYISGGRKAKMRPGDILGALTGESGGLESAAIGKIEVHDHFSYVAVSEKVAKSALISLREGTIKGRKFNVEMVH